MFYVLILTLIVNGQRHEYVADTGLTADECRALVRQNPNVPLSCVIDADDERNRQTAI